MLKYVILSCVCIGFVLGWLFPIEGPYDESYEQVTNVNKKKPVKAAPAKSTSKEVLIDLDADDVPEWYVLIPQTFDLED